MTVWILVQFLLGFALLIGGAEFLVRGASRLAITVGVSPLVVGLTVVAYGTSAPEIAVSAAASLAGKPDLTLGNVVGSNICNVLMVLGSAALLTPIAVDRRLVRQEVPLMIGVSVAVFVMAITGARIDRWESLLLLLGAVGYTLFTVVQGRRGRAPDLESVAGSDRGAAARSLSIQIGLIGAGLFGLVLGSDWLVLGATEIARMFGASELVIGLTVVAIGTSLPEVATSVVAALRGERDLAVGNIVGSNLLNLLAVLGVAGAVGGVAIPVPSEALAFDLPVMVAVAFVCLPVFWTGARIERWEGVLLLAYYVAYLAFLVRAARAGEDSLAGETRVMIAVAVALSTIVLVGSLRNRLAGRRPDPRP
jgi:cation:H+ antiporter